MSRITSNFIKFGTGTKEVSSRDVPANFTPSNYTPAQVASEGDTKVSAHLKGIDTKLGLTVGSAGDIGETSFSAADNQTSAANVTGLSFSNAVVRSFESLISITRGTTYQQYKLNGIQKLASWEIDQSSIGDDCGIIFTITTLGQIQYTSSSTGLGATIKFRAITTSVA